MLHAAGPHQTLQEFCLMPPSSPTGAAEPVRSPIPLSAIADTISRLRFGAVTLTVHDGRLVQMDVTERQRFS
ncbi:hypothetical protein IP68_06930 [Blastomonas sp. AAP25]|jgi:hypothetical protein|nr:hypothetical protein IP68_06930 [Blastomonas sp. AAP25]